MGAATRSESSVVLPARIVVPGVIALRHLLQRVLGFLARPVRSQKIRHLGGVVIRHHGVGLEVVPPVPVGHRSSSKSPLTTLLLRLLGAPCTALAGVLLVGSRGVNPAGRGFAAALGPAAYRAAAVRGRARAGAL